MTYAEWERDCRAIAKREGMTAEQLDRMLSIHKDRPAKEMAMTPLRRAIEAVHNTPRRKGDAKDLSDEGAEDIVRAVLMAIREPDTKTCLAGEATGNYHEGCDPVDCFPAMIDSILEREA